MLIKEKREKILLLAVDIISSCLNNAINTKGFATLALVGGSSVSNIYSRLKEKKINWKKVHIFVADERLVDIKDKTSNYNLIYKNLLKDLIKSKKLPLANVNPFIFSGKINSDLSNYEKKLKFKKGYFDFILLSSGKDGHIASLYPNHQTILSNKRYFISTDSSPKPPKVRMSSSKSLITHSKAAMLLFFGKEKRKAFENFNDSSLTVIDCPAKLVNHIKESYVLTDIFD